MRSKRKILVVEDNPMNRRILNGIPSVKYEILEAENADRQRQELLDNSLPGGILSGYIEEGYPFYFVNRLLVASYAHFFIPVFPSHFIQF